MNTTPGTPSPPSSSAAPLWLAQALADPKVTDLCLNGGTSAFVDRGQGWESLPEGGRWSDEDMRNWVLDLLAWAGKSWDARHPFVDATLQTGHRLHVAFPPLARQGILVSLRRIASNARQAHEERWATSGAPYPLLLDCVRRGDSILLIGATGSGKTTLASDLLAHVPESERILALEDTPELRPAHPHFVSLTSRPPNADGHGEVTLRSLLKQALRMKPDRIVLGECRGSEVLELLQALNTGHHGAMATLHANSPRDALRRIELLCLLAAQGAVPLPAIRELIAVGIQWVVQVERTWEPGGAPCRRIREICRIEGREGDTILMRPIVKGAPLQ